MTLVPPLLEDPSAVIEKVLDSYNLLSVCESQGHPEVEEALEIQSQLHSGTLLKSPATTKTENDDEMESLGGTTLVLGEPDSQQASLGKLRICFLFESSQLLYNLQKKLNALTNSLPRRNWKTSRSWIRLKTPKRRTGYFGLFSVELVPSSRCLLQIKITKNMLK